MAIESVNLRELDQKIAARLSHEQAERIEVLAQWIQSIAHVTGVAMHSEKSELSLDAASTALWAAQDMTGEIAAIVRQGRSVARG